ncbi:hypothetical protein [Actinoplanes sp. HUAS TT8]|uniref:hypothetical protein n=1 Tax=Actinoplanes sp. HUAS TT8 TaxID=3447453 RepID=UPI003F527B97
MNEHDDLDPLAGLQDWARKTERKVRRQRRFGGFVSKLRYVVMAGVATALIVAAVPLIRSAWPDHTEAAPAAVDGVTATTSASARPTSPFEGTAAATYPVGEKGITLPPAKAVTGFSAAEVTASLNQVRKALVAAHLDPDMTIRHKPDRFLALLSPTMRASTAGWFKDGTGRAVATWIDPAVKLDARNPPRVSGRVTYASVADGSYRTLRVTTNFVWVYAFEGDFAYKPLAVSHSEIVWDFPKAENMRAEDKGMWIQSNNGYNAWVDCAAIKKGLLAPTPKGGGGGRPDLEDEAAMAKADHSLDVPDDCP